jgi:hypothetical protein
VSVLSPRLASAGIWMDAMRRAARVDHNHAEIVRALRDVGATVESLAAIGSGCPDALVGFRGVNVLLEIKNPNVPKSDQQLTRNDGIRSGGARWWLSEP